MVLKGFFGLFDGESKKDRRNRVFLTGVLTSFLLALAYVNLGVPLNASNVSGDLAVLIDNYVFMVSLLVGSVSVFTYFVKYRDFSEAVGGLLVIAWALFSGLEDIFVYLLMGKPVPDSLSWLLNAPVGYAASFLGFESVGSGFLLFFVAVTGLMVYRFLDYLFFEI